VDARANVGYVGWKEQHLRGQNTPRCIDFISCAPHQTRLFAYLRKNLPAGIEGGIVHTNRLAATPGFWRAALSAKQAPPIDEIMALDWRKRLVRRRFAALDGVVHAVWGAVAAIYFAYFLRYFARRGTELAVVWGGFQLPVAASVAAARRLGIRLVFCENGYLPKTIVMDPAGINARNSLAGRTAEFYRGIATEPQRLRDLLEAPAVARPLKFSLRSAAEETVVLPERFVFLPLQVHDDSQILFYSPRFADMPSLIRFCAEGAAAQGLRLVVKEHPSDNGRVDYAAIRAELPEVVFTKRMDTQELIRKAQAVATVNSTVGIEALVHFKPVITLGEAFYAVPGVVTPCGAGFGASLREALARPVDRDLVARFLYHLRYGYLVPLDRRDPSSCDPAPAVARLREALP